MVEASDRYTIEEFTASDGYKFRYRKYSSEQEPRANIVYLHGIQSHSGWYEYSCTKVADAGYCVSFLDRRGSGMNNENRGDAPGFRRLIDDIAEFLYPLKTTSIPVILLAVSWGGKLAAALQKRHPGLTDALALLCPGICPKVRPSLLTRLTILWSRIRKPTKYFEIPLNDPTLFTANPRWLEFLENDPLSLKRGTARLLLESARLDAYLRFVPKWIQIPVLLMLTGKDRIIDNQRTRRYVERFATKDKTIIEYPDSHHTLEFEHEPDVFIKDLLEWIDKHIR